MLDIVTVYLKVGEPIQGVSANWKTAGGDMERHLILVVQTSDAQIEIPKHSINYLVRQQ